MKRAFTLIELMLVVIIIGVLSAMVVPRLAGRSEQARAQAAKTDINSSIPLALDLYEMDMGKYPDSLESLRTRPADGESWRGPYLKKKPVDPWGKPYVYKAPGDHNQDGYDLSSLGPDGQPGTVIKLDLSKLLFTEYQTALGLDDEAANPRLQPYDQITLYEIPGFRPHRTITVSGQVKRPGGYVITDPKVTLSQIIERAGGLTDEAMPKGAIFLRNALEDRDLAPGDIEKTGVNKQDPTAQGLNEVLQRLNETKRDKTTSALLASPIMHGLLTGTTNRMVVDVEAALRGDVHRNVVLRDGDQIIIPRKTESAYIVGEVASPFASFQVQPGDKVRDVIKLAGGVTRNADTGQVRLLKADGRILDGWVEGQAVEPGDAILVPQRFRVNTTWQDNLQAIMPLAIIYSAVHR